MKRGAVVLVDFPFASGAGSKVRPALIVQNDRGNARLQDTIVVPITSTFHQSRIVRTIGHFSAATMTAIDDCLKEALGIP